MDIPIQLSAFAILLAATAFFSASEYAIVKVRSTRIDQLVEEGHKHALAAKKVVTNVDNYLFTCQVGITMSMLGIGWLGHAAVEQLMRPWIATFNIPDSISTAIAFLLAFLAVALLSVVIGELTPKTIAIHKAEEITLATAKPLLAAYRLLYVFIWVFNGLTRFVAGLFGIQQVSRSEMGHTEEDLRMLLSDSLKSGEINSSEYAYVNKIFEFDDRIAKEIMVPRTEMSTIEKDMTLKEVFDLIGVEQFTRYPITDGDKDNVIGVINMKHLLTAYIKNSSNGDLPVSSFALPIIQVIDTMPVSELLLKIQRERIHMAILRDEYGGTSGLVTIEDIIEEIVGDIRDEFDIDEVPEVQKIGEDHYIFDAKMLIETVNDTLGIEIEEEDIDTIGGWFMTKSFDAIKGQKIVEQGYEFLIKDIDGHHILYLEVQKLPEMEIEEE
ncbi:hemolysin family protein [Planococcus salinus]|uniref:HlyC/CorC family transporter n=1 Tax=Planococcus salinus TaxID=1848460 RepID=A0A3M8P701_9BACL|nr:hemolysin family protein [Planococcus salinus]RNF39459.1 HlyC/CorC family transporter [Planococcus salinus]